MPLLRAAPRAENKADRRVETYPVAVTQFAAFPEPREGKLMDASREDIEAYLGEIEVGVGCGRQHALENLLLHLILVTSSRMSISSPRSNSQGLLEATWILATC